MWQKQDLKRRERQNVSGENIAEASNDYDNDDDNFEFDWIDELDHSRLDWLFI